MDQQLDLRNVLGVFKRRGKLFIIPAAVAFFLTIMVVILLPSKYKSTATILIEAQEIPPELVRTTVTGYVEERLQTITQLVLSRKNLLEIIKRYNLYADLADSHTTEEIIDQMREDITMDPVVADVVNPMLGKPMPATIAFALSYEGKNPNVVAQVANILMSLYLEENIKNREGKANTAFAFLEQQQAELSAATNEIEAKVSAFKDKHLYSLPELVQLNLQTIERLQKDIYSTEGQLQMLEDRRIGLKAELAKLDPVKYSVTSEGNRVMTPAEELKSLRSRYLALSASASEFHPDLQKLKSQIDALEIEIGAKDRFTDLSRDLKDKKTKLDLMAGKYSDQHPDYIRLKAEIAALDKRIQDTSLEKRMLRPNQNDQPDNPAYIVIQTQLDQTNLEISKYQSILSDLRSKYNTYQGRLELTPRVEQEYSKLQRDYANTQAKYRDTASRLQAAKEAKGLEENKMAEKLTVVDPPIVPEKPFKPKRLMLLILGLFLSVGIGLASGIVAEVLDSSVHSAEDLIPLTSKPVFATVPYMEIALDRVRRARRRLIAACSTGVAFLFCLVFVHFLFRPLNVIWFQVLRKAMTLF